jgi:hypothetical protein
MYARVNDMLSPPRPASVPASASGGRNIADSGSAVMLIVVDDCAGDGVGVVVNAQILHNHIKRG